MAPPIIIGALKLKNFKYKKIDSFAYKYTVCTRFSIFLFMFTELNLCEIRRVFYSVNFKIRNDQV